MKDNETRYLTEIQNFSPESKIMIDSQVTLYTKIYEGLSSYYIPSEALPRFNKIMKLLGKLDYKKS